MQYVFCEVDTKGLNSARTNFMLQRFEEITSAEMKNDTEFKVRNC